MTSQNRYMIVAAVALAILALPSPGGAAALPAPVNAAGALIGVAECVAVPSFAEAAAAGTGSAYATATAGGASASDGPRYGAAATFATSAGALTTSSSASVSGTVPVLGGAFSVSAYCSFSIPPLPPICRYLDYLRIGAGTSFGQGAASYNGDILESTNSPGVYFFQGTKTTEAGTVSFTKGFDTDGRLMLTPDMQSDSARPGISFGCPRFQVTHSESTLAHSATANWV